MKRLILVALFLNVHAGASVPELASVQSGAMVPLVRILSTGEAMLHPKISVRRVTESLAESADEAQRQDRATLLASFVHHWPVIEDEKAPNPYAPSSVESRLDGEIERFSVAPWIKTSFRNLLLAYQATEIHRVLVGEAENEVVRLAFARQLRALRLVLIEKRGGGSPTDAQTFGLLTQFRGVTGTDDRATWWQVVDDLTRNSEEVLKKEKGKADGIAAAVFSLCLAAGVMTPLTFIAGDTLGFWHITRVSSALSALMGFSPLIGPLVGAGLGAATIPSGYRKARRRVEEFTRECHARLVQRHVDSSDNLP